MHYTFIGFRYMIYTLEKILNFKVQERSQKLQFFSQAGEIY